MDAFSLNLPLELDEQNYMIAITILEVCNSVFIITEYNNIFKIYTPGYWDSPEVIENLEVIEQSNSSQNKLHVEEVNHRGLEIKAGLNFYHLSDLEDYSSKMISLNLKENEMF